MAIVSRSACRTRSLILQSALVGFVAGSGASASEPAICYSKFSHAERQRCKSAFSEEMTSLNDALLEAYNGDPRVVDIPIALDGSLYLASTCEYATSIRRNLDRSIVITTISEEEYEQRVEVAGQSGRIIRLDCDW